jgi:hypothetical protein
MAVAACAGVWGGYEVSTVAGGVGVRAAAVAA